MQIMSPQIKVMYVKSSFGIKGSDKAFEDLENKLLSLKKRKFYGMVFGTPPNEEYWAGVEILDDHEPQKLNLPSWTIPGGKYIQEKLINWHKNIKMIGETFEKLSQQENVDNERPQIEFYRSSTELIIRVPIK